MWYKSVLASLCKFAVVKVDPSGQINMDFPGIEPKPFNIDQALKFKITEDDSFGDYQISAYLDDRLLGYILFDFPEYSPNTVHVQMATLQEYPVYKGDEHWEQSANPNDRTKSDMIRELINSGYDADKTTVTRMKWGIGKRLYQEFKKFVKKTKPEVKFITGDVHSKDAYETRNTVFGLPIKVHDPEGLSRYKITENTPQEDLEEMSKKISDDLNVSQFEFTGHADIPQSYYSVIHNIDKSPKTSTENSKQGGLT